MLKNNQNDNNKRTTEDSSSKAINLVGSATTIQGKLATESDVRIDGRIEGDLHTHTKVVLGEGGVIEGHVYCESSDISGQVKGNVYCTELLKLQASAKVEGDIITKRMAVEKGAMFNGQCTMKEQVEFPDQAKNNPKQSANESSLNQQAIGNAQKKSKS